MQERGLHQGLELRLETLAERIAALKYKMSMAKGVERIEEFAQAEQLEQRHKVLAEQLEALNREGPGFRQDLKAELEKLAYDLARHPSKTPSRGLTPITEVTDRRRESARRKSARGPNSHPPR